MARFTKGRPGDLEARLRAVRAGVALTCVLAAFALVLAGSSAAGPAATLPGSWRHVTAAPFALNTGATAAWTGGQMIVAGITPRPGRSDYVNPVENAAAYSPTANTWQRLAAPPTTPNYCRRDAVWTGSEMVVWGCRATAYNPATRHWRRLPDPPAGHGFTLWTGHEVVGWGGGCCGDAGSDGAAYNPATNAWRKLARSPLAPEQSPLAVWDGREVLVFVSGISASTGKLLPAKLARAAAYNPATDTWRVIARKPVAGGAAVWDGAQVVVVAAGKSGRVTEAYDPGTNHWRRRASLPLGRAGATPVWTGAQVIVWGGHGTPSALTIPKHAFAYAPRTDRWTTLAQAPMQRRDDPRVVWTGRQLVVVGGVIPTPKGSSRGAQYLKDGAAFTPAGL